MKGKNIILISSEAWGDVFVSKHHYANILSENNNVLFINPPSFSWTPKSLFEIPLKISQEKENLFILDYGNPFPLLGSMPKFVQDKAHEIIIKRVLKNLNGKNTDIIWSFDLKRFFNLSKWNAGFTIFQAVELIDHPFFINTAPYRHLVLSSADLVISIADIISSQAEKWNKNIVQINHGIEIRKFEKVNSFRDLPGSGTIKAGFVGNFQASFDFELLLNLASQNPDVDFIMVGPTVFSNLGALDPKIIEKIESLKKKPNVYFLGKVKSEILPEYIGAFDINLVIYADDFADGHCNPHKLMSYFYFGNITVSSFIDQYKNRPELVRMVRQNKDLPALFKEIMENLNTFNSPELKLARRKYAMDHDYKLLIEKIERQII